ncbi:ABC-three component system middle component 1 [Jeotgalibacillus terrae]|uniref:ABC-three component system middle component 1 n=1 Tax=Jeotgalibacillus terrae TaxID=587735 RepID=A0ABW5ZM37_9BACL|nr:ABC-three component system middle component 1 [Jeotgalibacillus terrae]MBM7581125.1 hypothetical protein [Jeotgalibacillus terrae]
MSETIDIYAFVERLFIELDYEKRDMPNFNYVKMDHLKPLFFKNTFNNTYFLVLFTTDISDLKFILENQANYFYFLKEQNEKLLDIDKNTSMLIFLPTNERSNEILLVEEDPYYFKKYILPYTEDQYNEFILNYFEPNNSKPITELLANIVTSVDLFNEFKNDPYGENTFNFVSNLFIKLPALRIPEDINKEIYLLKETIGVSLESSGLDKFKNELDLLISNIDIDIELTKDEKNEHIIFELFLSRNNKGEQQ